MYTKSELKEIEKYNEKIFAESGLTDEMLENWKGDDNSCDRCNICQCGSASECITRTGPTDISPIVRDWQKEERENN